MSQADYLSSTRYLLDSNECDFYFFMPDTEIKKNELGFFIKNKKIETYSYITPSIFGEENFEQFLNYAFSYFNDGKEYFVVKLVRNNTYMTNSKVLRDKQFIPYYQDISILTWNNNSSENLVVEQNLQLNLLDDQDLDRWVDVFFDAFSYPRNLKRYITQMVKLQSGNGIEFYVGSVDNIDVSCLCSFHAYDYYGVYGVGTKKHYQRRGYAHALMSNFMFSKLKLKSDSTFTLQVQKGSSAENLYSKLGFKQQYIQKRFDWNPSTKSSFL